MNEDEKQRLDRQAIRNTVARGDRTRSQNMRALEERDQAPSGSFAIQMMAEMDEDMLRIKERLLRSAEIRRSADEYLSTAAPERAATQPSPKPAAIFEGYVDGKPRIQWTGEALPVGAELYVAATQPAGESTHDDRLKTIRESGNHVLIELVRDGSVSINAAIKLIERKALAAPISEDTAEPTDANEICQLPPDGWYCTRKAGHDGPCAALQHEPDRDLDADDYACIAEGMARIAARTPAIVGSEAKGEAGSIGEDEKFCELAGNWSQARELQEGGPEEWHAFVAYIDSRIAAAPERSGKAAEDPGIVHMDDFLSDDLKEAVRTGVYTEAQREQMYEAVQKAYYAEPPKPQDVKVTLILPHGYPESHIVRIKAHGVDSNNVLNIMVEVIKKRDVPAHIDGGKKLTVHCTDNGLSITNFDHMDKLIESTDSPQGAPAAAGISSDHGPETKTDEAPHTPGSVPR